MLSVHLQLMSSKTMFSVAYFLQFPKSLFMSMKEMNESRSLDLLGFVSQVKVIDFRLIIAKSCMLNHVENTFKGMNVSISMLCTSSSCLKHSDESYIFPQKSDYKVVEKVPLIILEVQYLANHFKNYRNANR